MNVIIYYIIITLFCAENITLHIWCERRTCVKVNRINGNKLIVGKKVMVVYIQILKCTPLLLFYLQWAFSHLWILYLKYNKYDLKKVANVHEEHLWKVVELLVLLH